MTRFSGISWKFGTRISSDNYRVKITPSVIRLSKVRVRIPMIGMAIMVEIGLLLFLFGVGYLLSLGIGAKDDTMLALVSGSLIWIVNIGMLVYLWVYIFGGRVREWHGLEHKLIAAAEQDDVANAAKYSPVHDRCGGTYFLSMLVYMPLAGWVVWRLGIFPLGFITLTSCMMVVEARTFHKYNTIGIRFGRWVQERFTVKEPGEDLLQIGIPAMLELMKREKPGSDKNILQKQ